MTTETSAILHGAPWGRRVRAYLGERFPLYGHVALIFAYYSSNQFLAKALTRPGQPVQYDLSTLLGATALLCFFFHLRVFDEHKDFEEDLRFHPQRILQRGVITLRDLRLLAGIAIGVEILVAAILGPAALVALAIAFAFSLLMMKEFFARDWLRRHFLVYATSHMLVMPLLSLMVFSFTTRRMPWESPPLFWLYAAVGFFVTFNVEVSRKIRAPEQEVEGLETYSKIFGTYGAAWIVMAIRVIDTGLVAIVGAVLGVHPWFYAALLLLFILSLGSFLRFRFRTTPSAAKMLEVNAGIYLIAFDLILAAELIRSHGLRIGA